MSSIPYPIRHNRQLHSHNPSFGTWVCVGTRPLRCWALEEARCCSDDRSRKNLSNLVVAIAAAQRRSVERTVAGDQWARLLWQVAEVPHAAAGVAADQFPI